MNLVTQVNLHLLQPALLIAFQNHKEISTYLNEFSQNTKRSMKKAIKRISLEMQNELPPQLVSNLRGFVYSQYKYLEKNPGVIKMDDYDSIPNLRHQQLANEKDTL